MIDVVLRCLNEAAARPWMLSRMPDGFRVIVADNGSTDGSDGGRSKVTGTVSGTLRTIRDTSRVLGS